jgi:hypothetical protein
MFKITFENDHGTVLETFCRDLESAQFIARKLDGDIDDVGSQGTFQLERRRIPRQKVAETVAQIFSEYPAGMQQGTA